MRSSVAEFHEAKILGPSAAGIESVPQEVLRRSVAAERFDPQTDPAAGPRDLLTTTIRTTPVTSTIDFHRAAGRRLRVAGVHIAEAHFVRPDDFRF